MRDLPARVRLRSLDPLARFDQTFTTDCRLEKIGTQKVAMEPGDEPEKVDVKVPVSGPFPLKVFLDPRFEHLPQTGASIGRRSTGGGSD